MNPTPACEKEHFYKLDNLLLSSCEILQEVFRSRWRIETGKAWKSTEEDGKELLNRLSNSLPDSNPSKCENFPKTMIQKGLLEEWDTLSLCFILENFGNPKNQREDETAAVNSLKNLTNELNNNFNKSLTQKECDSGLKTLRESFKVFKMEDEKINKIIKSVGVTSSSSSAAWEEVKDLLEIAELYLKKKDFDNAILFYTKSIKIPNLIPFHQALTFRKRSGCYLTLAKRLKAKQDPEFVTIFKTGMADAYESIKFDECWEAHKILAEFLTLRGIKSTKLLYHFEQALSMHPDPDPSETMKETMTYKFFSEYKKKEDVKTSPQKTTSLPKEKVMSKETLSKSGDREEYPSSSSPPSKTPRKKVKAAKNKPEVDSNSNISDFDDVDINTKVSKINSDAQLRINEATRDFHYLTELFQKKNCFNKSEKKEIINIMYRKGTDIYETLVYPQDIYKKLVTVVTQLYQSKCVKKSKVGEEDMKIRFTFTVLSVHHNESSELLQNSMKLAKKGAEMYPENPYFQSLLSFAYIKVNDHEGGLCHVEEALKKFPNQAELFSARVVHLDKLLGETEEEIWRRVEAYEEYIHALPQDHWIIPELYYLIAKSLKGIVCAQATEELRREQRKILSSYYLRGMDAEEQVHSYFQSRLNSRDRLDVRKFMADEICNNISEENIELASEKGGAEAAEYNDDQADFVAERGIAIDSGIVCEYGNPNCDGCAGFLESCGGVEWLYNEGEMEVENEEGEGNLQENVRVTPQDNKIIQEETEVIESISPPEPSELATFDELTFTTSSQDASENGDSIGVTSSETNLSEIESSKSEMKSDSEPEERIELGAEIVSGQDMPNVEDLIALFENIVESCPLSETEAAGDELKVQSDQLVQPSGESLDDSVSKCLDLLLAQWKMNAQTGVEESLVEVAALKMPAAASLKKEEIDELASPPPPPLEAPLNTEIGSPSPPIIEPASSLNSPEFRGNNVLILSQDTLENREPKASFQIVRKVIPTLPFYNVPTVTETLPIVPPSTPEYSGLELISSHKAPKDNYNVNNEPRSPPHPPPETAPVFEPLPSSHESSATEETASLTKVDLINESPSYSCDESATDNDTVKFCETQIVTKPSSSSSSSHEAQNAHQPQLQNKKDSDFLVKLPLYFIAIYFFAQGYTILAIFMILYVSLVLQRAI